MNCHCNQCQYDWAARKGPPACCPRCKRYDWAEVNKKTGKKVEPERPAVPGKQCSECFGMNGMHQKSCGKKSRTKQIPGQNQGG